MALTTAQDPLSNPLASGAFTSPGKIPLIGSDAKLTPDTWTLPESGEALPLVPADIEQAARELGVDVAAVHAVATVESGGRTGFDEKKRPKIRYENHYFRRLTHKQYDKTHPDLSNAFRSKGYRATHGKGSDQWALLKAAFELDPKAAVMSCSWGMFQVMGELYKDIGWTDLKAFVTDMFYSEAQHLRAFIGVVRMKKIVPALKAHNWALFAMRYNGGAYKTNAYDVKLRQAYESYVRHH
jgi:hypothetical protein